MLLKRIIGLFKVKKLYIKSGESKYINILKRVK